MLVEPRPLVGQGRRQTAGLGVGHTHLEDQQRDGDGEDTVAERLEPTRPECPTLGSSPSGLEVKGGLDAGMPSALAQPD